ncbi:MAG TPA: FHA domain-containing protein [Azospira sp.]|nr:FHA domain-containing protein [Azospira sp.]
MAKLILSMDGLVLKEIALTKERMSIGRKPHNDIQIDNLAISGEHAALVTILNDSFLEDLNSTNGTLVNGQPIKKHFLQSGDVIELGKYKLKYLNDAPAAKEVADDFEKTMILRPGAPRPAAAGEATLREPPAASPSPVSPPPAASAPLLGAVQILNGANAGKELELVKNLTTLGKPGVQVAVITRRPHGYFITHVEGGQFPVVNGKTLDAQAHPLADHDVIEIAGVKMEFFLKN